MAKLTTTDRSSRKAFLLFLGCAGNPQICGGTRNHELRIPPLPSRGEEGMMHMVPCGHIGQVNMCVAAAAPKEMVVFYDLFLCYGAGPF